MAKNIRWQIPFVSIGGTHYRIDIYDEGTFTPVTLTGGTSPFITSEDDSDDYFAPIRTQSGTIEVCTLMPDGNYITLDDLLPANNIARPVRLINRDNSDAIEWQGFLSCEAYDQEYTGIPQILQLPVISVLEALDSVCVEVNKDMTFKLIIAHIAYAMKEINEKSGMLLFRNIYLSSYVQNALISAYLYNTSFFSTSELVNEDDLIIEVNSISTKKILEQVAKFFGCVWREYGRDIYFELVGRKNSYKWISFVDLISAYLDPHPQRPIWETIQFSELSMTSLEWKGSNHSRTVMQGMRRVEVSAKLKGFECNLALTDCPVNNLVENPQSRHSTWGVVHVNTNETFYSIAEHKHMLLAVSVSPYSGVGGTEQYINNTTDINYNKTSFWIDNVFRTHYYQLVVTKEEQLTDGYYWVTSFMALFREGLDLKSGLMICGLPKHLYYSYSPISGIVWNKFALTQDNYIYRQQTPLIFTAEDGYMNININTLAWASVNAMKKTVYGEIVQPTITIALQFGDKWLVRNETDNPWLYSWSDSFNTVDFPLEIKTTDGELKTFNNWLPSYGVDERDGIFVKINSRMTGYVTLYIYHELNAICLDPYTAPMFDTFISKMEVQYIPLKNETLTNRGENTYAIEIKNAFRDELSVGCELASYANNAKTANMLWSNSSTPIRLLSLGGNTVRPEKDLLGRLVDYYNTSRQKLELEIKHPDTPLPLIRMDGIEDGKQYLPLSESRDWQTEVCTLTCFETPKDPPSES